MGVSEVEVEEEEKVLVIDPNIQMQHRLLCVQDKSCTVLLFLLLPLFFFLLSLQSIDHRSGADHHVVVVVVITEDDDPATVPRRTHGGPVRDGDRRITIMLSWQSFVYDLSLAIGQRRSKNTFKEKTS